MEDHYTLDEEKLYEELYNLIGAKIRFTCDGYLQEGIISSIKPAAKQVMLQKVYFILPNKRVFSGALRYRFSDLEKYEVVATAQELNPYPKNEYLENLIKNNNDVGKKYSLNDLFFDGLLSEESDEEEEVEEKDEKEVLFKVPQHLEKRVPSESAILDAFDLEWKQAIRHIQLQRIIGVSFHGNRVSRLGNLSWLCISTKWCVFLIDIEKLGENAFENGLKSILEDARIKKVIHDCRFASDCLAHKYHTRLVNVFDTLVAEFIISMQRYKDKYKYEFVQSLNHCLVFYLEIPQEYTYALDRCIDTDAIDCFSKRPLDNKIKHVLMKNTIYLLLLHKELDKKLLEPLHINVKLYLQALSEASQAEFDSVGDLFRSPKYILPACYMWGIQTVQFRKPQKKATVSLECTFIDPQTGKQIDTKTSRKGAKSTDLDCTNRISKDFPQKVSNKENRYGSIKSGRPQRTYIQEDKRCIEIKSSQLEEKSSSVDKMILKPSGRYIDEIYHKLANNRHFNSKNAESVVNVKPPERYVSKFTMRMPLECVAFSESSSDSASEKEVGITSTNHESTVEETCASVSEFPDYSDTWAKLRACPDPPQASISKLKYKFVPAGMSC